MSSLGTSPPARARGSRNTSRERSGWRHVRPWRGRGCRSAVSARLQLVLAAVCFSTAGAAIKWCAFGAAQVAAFRAFVAMLAIVLLIPASRHHWSARTALVGVAYAAAGLLFVFANKLTTAANSVFLQATNPLFVVALAPWLLHERVLAADLRFMAVVALGRGVLFLGGGRRVATAPHPLRGNLPGAGSAVAWAFTVTGYRWLARQAG